MSRREVRADADIISAAHFHDPYDAMSDEEFDAYVSRLFDGPRGPSRSITVRMPEDLLTRLQRLATARHMPYQRLMKRMLEESVSGLERRSGRPKRIPPKGTKPAQTGPEVSRPGRT